MGARLPIVDSGGTTRLTRRLIVVDSGGTSRVVRRAFVIDSGGTARQFFSGEITAQINGSGGYVRSGGQINLQWTSAGAFSSNANGGGGNTSYNWLLTGNASDAQIFVHDNYPGSGGAPVTGVTLDTWLDLSSTRTVSQAWPGGVGSSAFNITVSIRDKNTTNVVAGPTTIAGGTSP